MTKLRENLVFLSAVLCNFVGISLTVSLVGEAQVTQSTTPALAYRQTPVHTNQTSASNLLPEISDFLDHLANDLPTLVHEGQDGTRYGILLPKDSTVRAGVSQLRAIGLPGDIEIAGYVRQPRGETLSSRGWLDNFRKRWGLVTPMARTRWLFGDGGGLQGALVPALIRIAREKERPKNLDRVAAILLQTASSATNYEVKNGLLACGLTVQGTLALADGDTSRALHAFLGAAKIPRSFVSILATKQAVALATAHQDTTSWIMALTLQHLKSGKVDSSADASLKTLQELYTSYVMTHRRTPSDIFPERMTLDPAPVRVLSLDAFLNRQWTGYYDREFPAHPVELSDVAARSTRLVVVEYWTGIHCSGCWQKDMGYQPLTRAYPVNRVLPLSYAVDGSFGGSELAERFDLWYKEDWGSLGKSQQHLGLPWQTRVTSSGDTLDYWGANVDGHGLLRDTHKWSLPGSQSFFIRASEKVQGEIARLPEAVVHLGTRVSHDSVHVVTTIDSVQGRHSRLALRLVLFEDTVWKHRGTVRRIYQNVVRAAAPTDSVTLGILLSPNFPQSISYSFDISAIQAKLLSWLNPDSVTIRTGRDREMAEQVAKAYQTEFPDPQDWMINRNRLHVVAFIQDLDTGDVLQAHTAKVMFPNSIPHCY